MSYPNQPYSNVPTAAQLAQIAVLQQAVATATTDVGLAAAVCALSNYRELVWKGYSQPGLVDDGRAASQAAPSPYKGNWTAGTTDPSTF